MSDDDGALADDTALMAFALQPGVEAAVVNGGAHRGGADLSHGAAHSARPRKNGSAKRPRCKNVAANDVIRSFNTWAFKREQPANPHLMAQIVSDLVALREPVPFVLYWGKGPRAGLGEPDIKCLDYLAAFARRVREIYEPGAAVTLIFTDTHAQLNGHSPASFRQYFGEVEAVARQRGFESCWLGQLTPAAEAALASASPETLLLDDVLLRRLCIGAMKWYRGDGTPEQGALKYFRMSMVERRAVELAFPRSIFVTFNSSEFRALFPQHLPIFYMYSLQRGARIKPWFIDSAAGDVSASQSMVW